MFGQYYFFVTPSGVVMNRVFAYNLQIACAVFRIIHKTMTLKQIEEFVISAQEAQEFYHWKTQLNLALKQIELA